MPTLRTTVDSLRLPNPFVIASGPPGTNANVINKAFAEGWGAVICKTVSLDSTKIVNVHPRYQRLRDSAGEVFGWENIELISDRPFEVWLDEFQRIKDVNPEGCLIASVMEEYNRGAWHEIVGRCGEAGVDAFELNMSCPHGLPERRMGSAMGEDPETLLEVCSWAAEAAGDRPVWVKLTPNVTRIEDPARAALASGCDGISAINTIRSVMGVDLETLRPEPSVEGYTTPGGYSSKAVMPIALRMCMEVAKVIRDEFPGRSLSGIGGIESGDDAAQFILLGCDTVQVCTGVMKRGYRCVREMCDQLLAFMDRHGFETIDDFRGHSLQYFTSHADLVRRQAEARAAARRAAAVKSDPVQQDAQWDADTFVDQSDALARG